jgi:acyl-homoserine lactone acylase PvdQ
VVVLAVMTVSGLATAGPASASVPSLHDRDVLVPGEAGTVPASAHSTDQIPLYSGLTPLAGNITDADIEQFFKPDPLGSTSGTPEAVPEPGLRIIRDSYDVPHIYGKTRGEAEFGAGWVAAEDRGLLMEAIRGAGPIAALDVPGIDAFGVAGNLQQFDPTPQTERFLAKQIGLAGQFGQEGKQILSDAQHYVTGIDAYYRQTGNSAKPWTVNDVVGAAALIGAVFGKGGGNQAHDAAILADLQQRLGHDQGMNVFDDLREAHDPETPTTLHTTYPYEPTPSGPTPGSVVIDPGSLQQVSPLTPRQHMSNALVLGPSRTSAGTTAAVMGPQVGYYYPEILLEMDLHGGGLDARGAAFPGTSLYVELGQGANFAWSATSSGSENIDQFAERLCNPDGSDPTRQSTHYLYRGQCRAMDTFDAGYLHPGGGAPGGEVVFHQTVHGPVSGTVLVHGIPYAITTERSTRGRDAISALGFEQFNDGTVHDPQTFQRAASDIGFTFNWFYADAHHAAYFSSGRLPVRAHGTNPSLPTVGTGQYDWTGFLPPAAHPQAVNPAGEQLVNWNNQPAPGWGAASDNWGEGPIDHVLLLSDPISGKTNDDRNLVAAMNQAATQDPRAVLVWPVIAKVLATGPAPDVAAQQAADLIGQWMQSGGHILDLNGDGKVDSPGAAILDKAWSPIVDAVLSPVLGPLVGEIPPDGDMSYVDKDLRTILGEHVQGRYSRIYCGNGDLATCRASLWSAISGAAATLRSQQGSNENAFRIPEPRIVFQPGVLPDTMPYTNRPTFQQVVHFGS